MYINTCNIVYTGIFELNITIYGKNNDHTFLQTVHNHKYYQLYNKYY